MNEKQSDLFDGRVRQALDGLPDAPPPGSTFDAGRLWEQLRPELATPVALVAQKEVKNRGVWWLVAATVAGLLAGLVWWGQENVLVSRPRSVSSQTAHRQVQKQRPVRTQTEDAAQTENAAYTSGKTKRSLRTSGYAWRAEDAETVQRSGTPLYNNPKA